jgi:hypothetical protein
MKPTQGQIPWRCRAWNALLHALSTTPENFATHKDLPCFLFVLISFVAGLAVSWQRWGNPLVDSGRELNVPLRLVNSEALYSGIAYIYGPLSPVLNSQLLRIFQPSLWLFWARGIFSTILILMVLYWLARQILPRLPATLACVAVTWICALKPQGNYILPYAYSGLDGGLLVLVTTALCVQSLKKSSNALLVAAGIAAAFAFLAKTELGAAAIATGLVAALVTANFHFRTAVYRAALFLVPALAIPIAVYTKLASSVGWQTLTISSHLFFGHVPQELLYFNGLRFGFAHPWNSVGLMFASLVQLAGVGGLLAGVCLLWTHPSVENPQSRANPLTHRTRVLTMMVICLGFIVLTALVLTDLGPFLSMPLLLVALGAAGCAAFFRAKRESAFSQRTQAGIAIILCASALTSLSRMILRVSTGGALSSFLLPVSVLLFVYLWLVVFPALFTDPAAAILARRLASILLCLGVAATAITLSIRYQRKFSFRWETSGGSWMTTPALGHAFDGAYQFVQKNTAPRDAVAVMPEGTSLLFLSGRRNPLHEEIVTPGFLDEAAEQRAIDDLRSSRTALILIANRTTPEFGESVFGTDYDRRLMSWIGQNYRVCGVFGSQTNPPPVLGSPIFFIRAYCLTSSSH